MKSKTPRSVRLNADTEERLIKLLENHSKLGMKFPDVLNFALSNLIDSLDGGAKIILDNDGPRLVWVELTPAEKEEVAQTSGAKLARKR